MIKKYLVILLTILFFSCDTSHSVASSQEKNKNTSIFEVGANYVDCQGMGAQKCLLVKKEGENKFSYFYDKIVGFNFEEGFTFKIEVRKEIIANPPADASNIRYTLVKVINKTAVIESEIEGEWSLKKMNKTSLSITSLTLFINSKEAKIKGNSGCNTYEGKLSENKYTKTLSFSGIAETKRACPNLNLESEYLKTLKKTTSYRINFNKLILLENGFEILEFSK